MSGSQTYRLLRAALIVPCAGMLLSCGPAQHPHTSFWAHREAQPSRLQRRGPALAAAPVPKAPVGFVPVRYNSPVGALRAWYVVPSVREPVPAVLYLHGDFRMKVASFEVVRPLVNAGVAVMLPTWRGEHDNPGDFELLMGELDDAVAAARWLAARPEVDPARVVAIGHSVGGALSALLSLREDAPLVSTISVGGVYVQETFLRWRRMPRNRDLVRFDVGARHERDLRTLGPNLRFMVHRHLAYVGREDTWFLDNAEAVRRQADANGAPFSYKVIDGDHMDSLDVAIDLIVRAAHAGRPVW